MKLRPYQEEARNSVLKELSNGSSSTLVVQPTGTGKTVLLGHVAKAAKNRVLVLAHREELIFQAQDKISQITGETPDIEMGDMFAGGGLLDRPNVVVSSVQTQNSGRKCPKCDKKGCGDCVDGIVRRMQFFDPQDFGLIIIDEAHHATAASYRRIIDFYKNRNPSIKVLGVTATPDRADEAALGKVFDSVAFEYNLPDAIRDGWLVPIKQEWVEVDSLDVSGVRTRGGDFVESELQQVLEEEENLHGIVYPTIEIAGDRPTLLFSPSTAHAERCCEIFNRHRKDSAIYIDGKTPRPERRQRLEEYAAGKYQYLCNCGVFLEGFDEPRIQVVAMARMTKSRALYAQCVGRGTRSAVPLTAETPEERREAIAQSVKPSMLVIDFVGNSGRHKLVSSADILGGNYEDDVLEAAVRKAKKKRGQVDMAAELREAEEELARKRREAIKAKASYSRQEINPFDVFDVTPPREPGWHKGRKPTPKQMAALEKFGIKGKELEAMSFWQATKLMDKLISRIKENKCSFKQARILAKYGESTDCTFQEASAKIDAIANNGWKPIG